MGTPASRPSCSFQSRDLDAARLAERAFGIEVTNALSARIRGIDALERSFDASHGGHLLVSNTVGGFDRGEDFGHGLNLVGDRYRCVRHCTPSKNDDGKRLRGYSASRREARALGRWKNPWLPAFVVALMTFSASVALLAVVLYRAGGDDSTAAALAVVPGPPTATATAKALPGKVLTFSGTLPAALDASHFRVAANGETPDLAFEPAPSAPAGAGDSGTATGAVTDYFVPVASLLAGIDSLTGAQWSALVAGSATMEQSGGVGGKAQFVAVESDVAVVTPLAVAPARTFPTYDALRAAMADAAEGPFVALVPLGEMGPAMMAIAIDGVDIVRGKGDAQHWPFVARTRVTGVSKAGQAALPAVQKEMTASLPKAITVVATGDILQSRCALTAIEATGDWAAALRTPVGTYLKSADLALGSLDGSIQDIQPSIGCVPGRYDAEFAAAGDGRAHARGHRRGDRRDEPHLRLRRIVLWHAGVS